MLMEPSRKQSASTHVIVLGNEKGGSGKSTLALHIAVALLKTGYRVASIDLDCRQQTLTRYIENRGAWAAHTGREVELPLHYCLTLGQSLQIGDNEKLESQQLIEAVGTLEGKFDFLIIDTPGTDSYLTRLAHSMADTLVTPLNDSFLDLDVIGRFDPLSFAITGAAHYEELVRHCRRKRRQLDGVRMDWVVVRNRLSQLGSRNKEAIANRLRDLSAALGFRPIDGLVERAVYREFFPYGLTSLDGDDTGPKARPTPAHMAARREVTSLLRDLKLPTTERGRRRAANRAEWFSKADEPLVVDEMLGTRP